MGNKYRTHQKIAKDKSARLEKRVEKLKEIVDYGSVKNVEKYLSAYKVSLRGVSWKPSVQAAMATPIRGMCERIAKNKNRNLNVPINTNRETVYERGKRRDIVPIKFWERVYEHVICDNILLPIYVDKLIFANGASLKGKGTEFSRDLMYFYLSKAVKQGYTYAIKFDVKSYFENIPHKTIYNILRKDIEDDDILDTVMKVILSYRHGCLKIDYKNKKITKEEYDNAIKDLYNLKDKGVCLGSQISQIIAIITLNALDHYIKDTLRMKYYIRYMDDGIILCKTKSEAIEILTEIYAKISETGLYFNDKKTYIVPLCKGFTFLKVKYRVKNGKKIVRTLHHSCVVRMRRKLKKFVRLVDEGKMNEVDVFNSVQSWWTHSFVASAYKTRKSILNLYKEFYTYKVDWFEDRLSTMHPKKKCA